VTRESDLLAAIKATPADDAPRAIYGDLLAERGDPRGEFIQLQLRGSQDQAASRAAYALQSKHGAAWAKELGGEGLALYWERGFPKSIISGDIAKVVAARALIRTQPILGLSLLSLAGDLPAMAELAQVPELAAIEELSLKGNAPSWQNIPPPARALAALAGSPYLHPRKLDIEENLLDDAGAEAFATAGWLAGIDHLVMIHHPGNVAPVLAAIRAARHIYIARCSLGERGARALAALPVVELQLDHCGVHEAGARILFGSLARVEQLRIVGDTLHDALEAFALATPTTLSLEDCSLTTAGTAAFVHRGSSSLVAIELANNSIGAGFAATVGPFPSLQRLDLRDNDLTGADIEALATARLPALASIGLSDNVKSGDSHVVTWTNGPDEQGATVVDDYITAGQLQPRFRATVF